MPDAPDRVCATKGVRGEGRNWSNWNLDLRQAYLEKRISRARTGRTVRESRWMRQQTAIPFSCPSWQAAPR